VGTLSYAEIEAIIAGGATVTLDEAAAVKIVTYNGNWVSYDDAFTLQKKVKYANSICLGSTMVWAVSLDDRSGTASAALAGSGKVPKSNVLLTTRPQGDCAWTACVNPLSSPCPAGQSPALSTTDGCGVMNDQISQAGFDAGFPHRHYCCPSNQVPQCIIEEPDAQAH
jgi:chitinase